MDTEQLKALLRDLPKPIQALCVVLLVATPILVAAVPYLGKPAAGEEVELVIPPPTSKAGWSQPISISRGETVEVGETGVSVYLDDVDTFKGNAKDESDANDGIAFNRRMPKAAHLMEAALERAEVDDVEAFDVLSKTQADWEKFLKDIGDHKADIIKEMPIAKLRLEAGEDVPARRATVVMKDTMALNSPLIGAIQIRVAEIVNTKKASGVKESIKIEFRKVSSAS